MFKVLVVTVLMFFVGVVVEHEFCIVNKLKSGNYSKVQVQDCPCGPTCGCCPGCKQGEVCLCEKCNCCSNCSGQK